MPDTPKIGQRIYRRFQEVGILIERRNELVQARASSYPVSFSYAGGRGEGRLTLELEMND